MGPLEIADKFWMNYYNCNEIVQVHIHSRKNAGTQEPGSRFFFVKKSQNPKKYYGNPEKYYWENMDFPEKYSENPENTGET